MGDCVLYYDCVHVLARTDDAHELGLLRQRRGGAHHLGQHAGDAAAGGWK
jgi:hypothetical protein